MSNYIKVDNLSKKFKNNAGVQNINFTIEKGELVGLIGDNGAGKTTTIKLIFGEYKPDAGQILFNGQSIKNAKVSKIISFFPDQNNFPKNLNIIEFATYSAALKNISKAEMNKTFELYVDALNLTPYKKNKFSELSAGMQKRALLLSVLVCNPEVIILDEPTANLDIKSRIEFMNILKFLSEKFSKTIIITSHNIDELNNLVDRVVLINKVNGFGEVIYDQKFDSKTENLKDIYLRETGFKNASINFEDIKTIESTKVENKLTNGFVNWWRSLSTFHWTIKTILKSISLIVFTSLVLGAFIIMGIIFAVDKTNVSFSSGLVNKMWGLMAVLIAGIGFYETKTITQIFSQHVKDSIVQLEIRSGKSSFRIFLERMLANKLIAWSFIVLIVLLFAFFGLIASTDITQQVFFNIIPGAFFLIVVDLFFTAVIFFGVSILRSSIFSGAIGTILTILLSIGFFISSLILSLTTSLTSYSQSFQHNEIGYQLLEDLQELDQKYGTESLVHEHLEQLSSLNNISDDLNLYASEYEHLLQTHDLNGFYTSDAKTNINNYLINLARNGLLTEASDLKVYKTNDNTPLANLSDLNQNLMYAFSDESISNVVSRLEDALNNIAKTPLTKKLDYEIYLNDTIITRYSDDKISTGILSIIPDSTSTLLTGDPVTFNITPSPTSFDLSALTATDFATYGLTPVVGASTYTFQSLAVEGLTRATGIELEMENDYNNLVFTFLNAQNQTYDNWQIEPGLVKIAAKPNNNKGLSGEISLSTNSVPKDLKWLNINPNTLNYSDQKLIFESTVEMKLSQYLTGDEGSSLMKGVDYKLLYNGKENFSDKLPAGSFQIVALPDSIYLTGQTITFTILASPNSLQPTPFPIAQSTLEDNALFSFFSEIKALQPVDNNNSTPADDSLFASIDYNHIADVSHRYENKNGFNALIDIIKRSNNQQLMEIASIVQRAARYSYGTYFKDSSYLSSGYKFVASDLETYSITSEDDSNNYPWTNTEESFELWSYMLGQDEFNQELNENLSIADGVRTFNKIYFDLLNSLNQIKPILYYKEQYPPQLWTQAGYVKNATLNMYLNPLISLSQILLFSGPNADLQLAAKHDGDGLGGKTILSRAYTLVMKPNVLQNRLLDQMNFYVENKLVLNTQVNYFNNNNSNVTSISQSALEAMILQNFNLSNQEQANLDIWQFGTPHYTNNQIGVNLYVADRTNQLQSGVVIEALFNILSGQASEQYDALQTAFAAAYPTKTQQEVDNATSTHNIYTIQHSSTIFNPGLAGTAWTFVASLFIGFGYLIFSRKLIF